MSVNYSLYRSLDLISNTSSTYVEYIRAAIAKGCERAYHYDAIPEGVKGIEPHIVLCPLTESEGDFSESETRSSGASPVPQATEDAAKSHGTLDSTVDTNDGDTKSQVLLSSSAIDQSPECLPWTDNICMSPLLNIPLGYAEGLIL